jgi:predicted nucleic-acid-binding protein
MKIVDANVVLRYLLNDIEDQTKIAANYLEQHKVNIPTEVLVEIVYVLESVYRVNRKEISSKLSSLISYPNIEIANKDVITESFKIYAQRKLDFVDCILCAYKTIQNVEIVTFDKKIKNFRMSNES